MHRKGNAALTTVLKQAQAGQRQRLAAIAIKVGPLTIGEQGGQLGPASQAMLLRVGLQPGLLLCLLRCGGGLCFGLCRWLTGLKAKLTIRLIGWTGRFGRRSGRRNPVVWRCRGRCRACFGRLFLVDSVSA